MLRFYPLYSIMLLCLGQLVHILVAVVVLLFLSVCMTNKLEMETQLLAYQDQNSTKLGL